jgi:hypothetical protein
MYVCGVHRLQCFNIKTILKTIIRNNTIEHVVSIDYDLSVFTLNARLRYIMDFVMSILFCFPIMGILGDYPRICFNACASKYHPSSS